MQTEHRLMMEQRSFRLTFILCRVALDSIIRIYYVSPIFSYNRQHEKNYLGSR